MTDNIANYYVLPLLKVNKASFGGKDNFVNAYITQEDEIIVEVKDKMLVPEENFIDKPEYMGDFDSGSFTFIVYKQPDEFRADVLKFVQGRYSEFTIKAKEAIINYSGLSYNVARKDLPKREDGSFQTETHKYLLALSKSPILKLHLEKSLGVKISAEAELVDKPNMNNFYPLPEQNK